MRDWEMEQSKRLHHRVEMFPLQVSEPSRINERHAVLSLPFSPLTPPPPPFLSLSHTHARTRTSRRPGLYADLEGNTVCLLCQVGRFIKAPGATVCESCLAGEYADQAGKSVCDLCAHGRYSADYNLRVFCR